MSGKFDEVKKKLAKRFDIDVSDRSKGIQISLPKDVHVHVHDHVYVNGVQIENGRVVRESRHGDSEYATWTYAVGPALTELERKPAATRVKDNGAPISLDDLEYAVVDTETTGGALTRGHRITEIAIVRVNARGKVLHEYATLVHPGRSIPAAITALTHIDNQMVRMAPRFEDIAGDVRALLDGRIFVAHNAVFDWGFVSGELVRTTGRPLYGKQLCTVRLARKVVPEIRRRSLDALQYFFDVENEARHRAFGDARATAVIFRSMMQRVRDREIETWQGLEQMTLRRSQRRKRTAMPTGMADA
ncbi:MAG: 3'-5' exonuclease [Gemmatimonadota bacterium]